MAKASRTQKLKVFRTPIGFHDAYVAAPSQKAALEAWGIDVNLFARGSAEQVTDPELMKEPLKRPGEVIKTLRATEEEQIRALGDAPAKAKRRSASKEKGKSAAKQKPRGPRPSRAKAEKAEKALEAAEQRHAKELGKLKAQIEALEEKKRAAEQEHRDERKQLQSDVEEAREEYAKAMAEWPGD